MRASIVIPLALLSGCATSFVGPLEAPPTGADRLVQEDLAWPRIEPKGPSRGSVAPGRDAEEHLARPYRPGDEGPVDLPGDGPEAEWPEFVPGDPAPEPRLEGDQEAHLALERSFHGRPLRVAVIAMEPRRERWTARSGGPPRRETLATGGALRPPLEYMTGTLGWAWWGYTRRPRVEALGISRRYDLEGALASAAHQGADLLVVVTASSRLHRRRTWWGKPEEAVVAQSEVVAFEVASRVRVDSARLGKSGAESAAVQGALEILAARLARRGWFGEALSPPAELECWTPSSSGSCRGPQ